MPISQILIDKMRQFLLVGLPGAGKTTTMQAWVQFLNTQGIRTNFVPTDVVINQRIRPDDTIIQQYEESYGAILPEVFAASNPSKAFIDKYGEPAMRDLEERLLVDMINCASEHDWLDFGGRALLLPKVLEAVKKNQIMVIFLSAKHETILKRLEKNDEWRQRPTYALATEKSTDGKGWIANAIKHREERVEHFTKMADRIISIETEECVLQDSKFTPGEKTSDEVIQEILSHVKIHVDPIQHLNEWLQDERSKGAPNPQQAVLSTASSDGAHSRIVAIREIDAQGLLFFTQRNTRKVTEMSMGLSVSMTFWFELLLREVIIEGIVEALSESENEHYWQSYPREAQIRFHSYASTSAQPIRNKQELEEKRKTLQQNYVDQSIPVSPFYCGFRLKPNRFVFYAYRTDELSDVVEYTRLDNEWSEQILSP